MTCVDLQPVPTIPPKGLVFLRWSDVEAKVGLTRRTINRLIAENQFPSPVNIGRNTTTFVEHEVEAWMLDRMKARPGSGEGND